MSPHSDLASSRYCLASPVTNSAAYLVHLPAGGSVMVDLSNTKVIHLVRDPVKVSNGIYSLGHYSGTEEGNQWYLGCTGSSNMLMEL